jgi:SAM-dependent methyltransferase
VTDSSPWIAAEAGPEARKIAPAAARNRDAICGVLDDELPETGHVLEIASGSGEHVVHFAARWPRLTWQPSDPEPEARRSIDAWARDASPGNLAAAIDVDVLDEDWPVDRADAILCINMIHIAPWAATLGLMKGAGRLLPTGGLLYLYGPFREADVLLAESNAAFDASLKSRNAAWGLRDLEAVIATAHDHGLSFDKRIAMPANNLSLVFRKR